MPLSAQLGFETCGRASKLRCPSFRAQTCSWSPNVYQQEDAWLTGSGKWVWGVRVGGWVGSGERRVGGVLLMWLVCHWPCLGRARVELENENTFHLRHISSHFLLSLGKKKIYFFPPSGVRSPNLVLSFLSFYKSLLSHSSGRLHGNSQTTEDGPGPVAESEEHRLVKPLWWHHQRE